MIKYDCVRKWECRLHFCLIPESQLGTRAGYEQRIEISRTSVGGGEAVQGVVKAPLCLWTEKTSFPGRSLCQEMGFFHFLSREFLFPEMRADGDFHLLSGCSLSLCLWKGGNKIPRNGSWPRNPKGIYGILRGGPKKAYEPLQLVQNCWLKNDSFAWVACSKGRTHTGGRETCLWTTLPWKLDFYCSGISGYLGEEQAQSKTLVLCVQCLCRRESRKCFLPRVNKYGSSREIWEPYN